MTTRPAHLIREVYAGSHTLLPKLKMVGWSRFDKATAHHLDAHKHPGVWEICYIVAGHLDWWAGSQMYEVNKGQIFITRPNEMHGGQDAIMHPCELYWLQITLPPRKNPRKIPRKNLRASTRKPARKSPSLASLAADYHSLQHRLFPGSDALAQRFEQLLGEHRDQSPHCHLAAQALLHDLLVLVLRLGQAHNHDQHQKRTRRTSRIEKIVQLIDAQLDQPPLDQPMLDQSLSIESLARQAGLGVSQFRARFGDEVGQSPNEYITHQRIIRAKHKLAANADLSITHIAHAFGFSTSQYFATVFKHRVGMTPGQYRARYATR